MFYIYCPYCKEKREELEFSYAEESFVTRPTSPMEISDEKWADYLFNRSNPKGECFEQWSHSSGCRKFFVIHRNNSTNEIIKTYHLDEFKTKEMEQTKKSNSTKQKKTK